jgi:aminomethyltransferase
MMQKTALYQKHLDLGAKMVPFAGFEMPVSYDGVKIEHQNVREHLGVFDVSHMGEFFVEGPEAQNLLQYVTSNDVSKLVDGQAQYTCLPNEKNGIVDDLIIYRFHAEKYMLVVNASNIDKDWTWISSHNNFKAKMKNASDAYSLLAVQGPKAIEVMQNLTEVDLFAIKFYHFTEATFAGEKDVIISATGYTGSGGFELYIKNESAGKVWGKIFEAGKDFNINPIGLAARDTLRLEMGYCLYGNDIDETTSPLEAKLGWITKFNKDFINKDELLKQKEEGVVRKLVAFELIEKGIPRKDYPILDEDNKPIGYVTSGTQSPSLNKAIGLGYVKTGYDKIDQDIYIQIRNKHVQAKVVKLPFYKG